MLELDLGTVLRNELETDFIEKLIVQLEVYFQTRQSSFDSNFEAEKKIVPAEISHLEILSFFIETGNLPWWTDFKDTDLVKESLDFLLRSEETALRHLLYESVRQPVALRRIVRQTGFPKWAELAATNLDWSAEELTSRLLWLMGSLKKISPWSNYSKHKLEEIVGLKLLPWAFLSPLKTPNSIDFWRGFLIQMTAGQSVNHDDLFVEFARQFEQNKQAQIGQDDGQDKEAGAFLWSSKTPDESLQAHLFERIRRFLELQTLTREKKGQWLEQLPKLNDRVLKG